MHHQLSPVTVVIANCMRPVVACMTMSHCISCCIRMNGSDDNASVCTGRSTKEEKEKAQEVC